MRWGGRQECKDSPLRPGRGAPRLAGGAGAVGSAGSSPGPSGPCLCCMAGARGGHGGRAGAALAVRGSRTSGRRTTMSHVGLVWRSGDHRHPLTRDPCGPGLVRGHVGARKSAEPAAACGPLTVPCSACVVSNRSQTRDTEARLRLCRNSQEPEDWGGLYFLGIP